jgi:hypothetical protein
MLSLRMVDRETLHRTQQNELRAHRARAHLTNSGLHSLSGEQLRLESGLDKVVRGGLERAFGCVGLCWGRGQCRW